MSKSFRKSRFGSSNAPMDREPSKQNDGKSNGMLTEYVLDEIRLAKPNRQRKKRR